MLCWVTLTKLNRPNWIATDFIFGAAVCIVMIAVNVARLYVTAVDAASYEYWHNGDGAQIFRLGGVADYLANQSLGFFDQ